MSSACAARWAPIEAGSWTGLREAVIITAIGLAIGAAGALALGRWAAPMLFDTSPRDPLILGTVSVVMLVTAVGASVLPALRAARVDPASALRADY